MNVGRVINYELLRSTILFIVITGYWRDIDLSYVSTCGWMAKVTMVARRLW